LTGLGIMAIPGVGPVVAAGWLAATAAVGGAAGGLIGALTDSAVPEEDAHVYAEGVRRGGALVTAKVDDARAAQAESWSAPTGWMSRRVGQPIASRDGAALTALSIRIREKKSKLNGSASRNIANDSEAGKMRPYTSSI
jgi:hypothetical protein